MKKMSETEKWIRIIFGVIFAKKERERCDPLGSSYESLVTFI